MKVPLISDELLAFMNVRYGSEPFSRSDSPDVLRWKAAQRAVVDDLALIHQEQKSGKKPDLGFKVRSDD